MACPSGCLNGGAQSRSEDVSESDLKSPRIFHACPVFFYFQTSAAASKELILGVESTFRSVEKRRVIGENSVEIDRLYAEWLGGRETDKAKYFLQTGYHEVEKMTNSLAIKW